MKTSAFSWANTLVGVHHSMSRALISKSKNVVFVYVNGTHNCMYMTL